MDSLWTDWIALSSICFFALNCTGREVLAANRVDGVEDLAYDWISKNLYWTDPRYRSISVMKVSDKSRRAIVRNLNNPRSIVVHPVAGWVIYKLVFFDEIDFLYTDKKVVNTMALFQNLVSYSTLLSK